MPDHSILPANVDAEKSILGGILLDDKAYIEASEGLQSEDFSLDSHRRIYRRIANLMESGRPVDMVTLIEALGAGGDLEAIGDVVYLSSLVHGVPERPSIAHYVQIVREKAALRRIIHACNATIARALVESDPVAIVRDLDGLVSSIGGTIPSRAHSLKELIPLVLNDMVAERDRKTDWIGIPTGIRDLDDALGGVRRSELWIVGGLPSQGKTSLGIEHVLTACAVLNAQKQTIPTVMFSMEMKERRIVRRILAAKTPAKADGARDARWMNDATWRQVMEHAAQLSSLPLWIDDSTGLTIPMLRSRLRRYKKEFKIEFAVVDYVGLMDGPGRNLTEQATGIAKGLQRIAKEEDIALVALSQLHRPKDSNPNERPTMLSLRNSGDFEANADVVLLIHRPMDLKTSTFTGDDEIIIGKARDGARGAIPVRYNDDTLVFDSRADR